MRQGKERQTKEERERRIERERNKQRDIQKKGKYKREKNNKFCISIERKGNDITFKSCNLNGNINKVINYNAN